MSQSGEHQIEVLQLPVDSKKEQYQLLAAQIKSLFEHEHDFMANMATFAAVIYHSLPDLNWAGYYLFQQNVLVVGPFQGKPACVRIPNGKGVCGTAAQRGETIVVKNVDEFPGHIACDSASRSEIVIPLMYDGIVYGVFDIDSPILSRFDDDDRAGLETLIATFNQLTDIPALSS